MVIFTLKSRQAIRGQTMMVGTLNLPDQAVYRLNDASLIIDKPDFRILRERKWKETVS